MLATSSDNNLMETLAAMAAKGDCRSFKIMYDLIARKMYCLCLRYAGNADDANDWFQDGFLKLYRNLSAFRFEGSFEGWARRIFVTTCIDGIKKRKILFPELPDDYDEACAEPDAFDLLSGKDIFTAIHQLPFRYRTVVNLYVVKGYNHKQIGELLSISTEGSRSRLFRGRLLLKKNLLL